MKRNLQLDVLSWETVKNGIVEAFYPKYNPDKQPVSWILRSLPDAYKEILNYINTDTPPKISNSNIAGAVYFGFMANEFQDLKAWIRERRSQLSPNNPQEFYNNTVAIENEITYYNAFCCKEMNKLDNMIQNYVEAVYENATNITFYNSKYRIESEAAYNAECYLNTIDAATLLQLVNYTLLIHKMSANYKNLPPAQKPLAKETISETKTKMRKLCCKLKALKCKSMIHEIWKHEVKNSLDQLEHTIGDFIDKDGLCLAKDLTTGEYTYSVHTISSQIDIEVKIRKPYLKK